jgi:hypothetical protein
MNKAIPKSLRGLKLVKPIKVEAPEIKKGDIPWSEVFEKISLKFKHREAHFGLCCEIDKEVKCKQAERMKDYISELLQGYLYLSGWLQKRNPENCLADMYEIRYHWCLHLAKQFKDAGY